MYREYAGGEDWKIADGRKPLELIPVSPTSPSAAAPTASTGEVREVDPTTGGMKGRKACEIGAMDPKALMEVGLVAGYGTEKYERYNFAKGYRWSLNYDALQRHLHQFWAGEDRDSESGLYHLAHAAWHCLALLTFVIRKKGTDDRFPS